MGRDGQRGWFIIQVGREHEFERLANLVGKAEWLTDPRLATRAGWRENMDVIRAGVAEWAAGMDNVEACHALAAAGIAAGPCLSARRVIDDPHVAARNMLVEVEPPNGGEPFVLPGNPVKMSAVAEGPETRMPWLGEHTDTVLAEELGLDGTEIERLRTPASSPDGSRTARRRSVELVRDGLATIRRRTSSTRRSGP